MAYYTRADLMSALTASGRTTFGAQQALRKQAQRTGPFDIFLSHAKLDEVLVLAAKEELERSTGLTVYVDWIDDPQLDRAKVTTATAATIRTRMRQCKALVYATSPAAATSRWMPWELGYFDGQKGDEHVSIMPILESSKETFTGLEFLGLYNTVEKVQETASGLVKPYAVKPDGMEGKTLKAQTFGSTAYTRLKRPQ